MKNPNFVYLAPSKIGFLQIVSTRGELLYAVELLDEMETREFHPEVPMLTGMIQEVDWEMESQLEVWDQEVVGFQSQILKDVR